MLEDIAGPSPVTSPGGRGVVCDVAPVPANHREDRIRAGVKFTVPTMRAGEWAREACRSVAVAAAEAAAHRRPSLRAAAPTQA
jgi:hypothetical protein